MVEYDAVVEIILNKVTLIKKKNNAGNITISKNSLNNN